MVKSVIRFLFLTLFFTAKILGQDLKVSANMSEYSLVEGEPLQGTLTITHDLTKKVDTGSFTLKGKPLKVEFVREVKVSADAPLVISIYSFQLPAGKQGLHILDPITVKVGDQSISSHSTTYQVSEKNGSRPAVPRNSTNTQQQTASSTQTNQLRIEATTQGPTTLFPGQRTKLVYRFLYSGYIDLLKETLPMLEAEGLKKIGSTQNRDYTEGNLSVSEFVQEVEADAPGTFSYGPSVVEGKAYTLDTTGNKVYAQQVLHSETAPVVITVEPFPEKDKPASFNGAIGQYLFNASLTSNPKAIVGDQITLLLEIIGDPSNFNTLSAPDLCCQPGFSGMFKTSDLPPESSVQENSKRFIVSLRPLSSAIREIPSIEFSSWDPRQGKYLVQKSPPIPFTVTEADGSRAPEQPLPALGAENTPSPPPLETQPQPIEIHQNEPIEPSDLSNKWGGSWWILLLVPVVLGLIYLQKNLYKEVAAQPAVTPVKKSEATLQEALKSTPGSAQFYQSIQQAFLQLLVEKRLISNPNMDPESLFPTGPTGEVRLFLMKLNALRFAKNKAFDPHVVTEAQVLFKKIQA